MRLYVTDAQLKVLAEWLRERDVAYYVLSDAFALIKTASDKKSWGCVLCPTYAPEIGWLWNHGNRGDLVETAVIFSPTLEYLLACPPWAHQDPFVRTLIRRLTGTKPPVSPIDWEKCEGGLVPVITQDVATGEVLMQAYMDENAFAETMKFGRIVYFSRSKRRLWCKGEESGHVQLVREIRIDCDRDSVLLKVKQVGGACHDGYKSCFYRMVEADGSVTIVGEPVFDPSKVYNKQKGDV